MKRALTLLLALSLAACGQAPGLDRLAPGEQARVADIHSGDAFTLDSGLEVRLAGVQAPRRDDPYGEESRAALKRLTDGRVVRLLYGGAKRDARGRALAQVKLAAGGLWLERALLRAGAVRVRTWSDNRAMAAPMLEAEAYARNRHIGLWKLPQYQVLVPSEADRAYGFQVVEARVRRLGKDGDAAILGLADEQRGGLEAEIAPAALPDFKTAAKSPEQLRGKLVRLRGPIRAGPDGPQMQLDHPEQVELLAEKP